MQAQVLQRGRGQAGAVALRSRTGQAPTTSWSTASRISRRAGRVEAARLDVVALDDQRAGDRGLLVALPSGAGVPQVGARGDEVGGAPRVDPVEPGSGGGEQVVDEWGSSDALGSPGPV